MFFETDTGLIAGPYDAIGIVKNIATGRFHTFVWEEKPLPSNGASFVRLKSKMHHTEGAPTFEEAIAHVAELRKKIEISDDNVWILPSEVIEKDFTETGYLDVMFLPDWKKNRSERGQETTKTDERPVDGVPRS